MQKIWSVVLVGALIGCGAPGSITLKLKKDGKSETITMGAHVDSLDEDLHPFYDNGNVSFSFATSAKTELLGEAPQVSVDTPWGVGRTGAVIYFQGGNTAMANPESHTLFIDEWRYTGDGSHPFNIKAHTDKTNTVKDPFEVDLTFEMPSACASHEYSGGFPLCGGNPNAQEPTVNVKLANPGGSTRPVGNCPDEITKLYVGAGAGASAKVDNLDTIKVDGASETLHCVRTLDSKHNVACGGDRTVKVGKCDWHVYSVAAPFWDPGAGNFVQIWVGATTDASCAEENYCNSAWTSTGAHN